jgi:hypothetical protein
MFKFRKVEMDKKKDGVGGHENVTVIRVQVIKYSWHGIEFSK